MGGQLSAQQLARVAAAGRFDPSTSCRLARLVLACAFGFAWRVDGIVAVYDGVIGLGCVLTNQTEAKW